MTDPMQSFTDSVDWLVFHGPHRDGLHATHVGWVRFDEFELQVYKLSDGQTVFDAESVERAFAL